MVLVTLVAGTVTAESADSDTESLSAWRQAIQRADIEAIERLLDAGVDVNTATNSGKTALMVAAAQGDQGLLGKLLEHGAAIDLRNRGGGTALMYAAQYGRLDAARTLFDRGARLDVQGINGWTALMIAVLKDREAVVEFLLGAGADPNLPDMVGWTPLMRAVSEDRAGVVRLLVSDPRLSIDARNGQEATALHIAAALDRREIARLLLHAGADPDVRDRDGNTAAGLARNHGFSELAEIIDRYRSASDH